MRSALAPVVQDRLQVLVPECAGSTLVVVVDVTLDKEVQVLLSVR